MQVVKDSRAGIADPCVREEQVAVKIVQVHEVSNTWGDGAGQGPPADRREGRPEPLGTPKLGGASQGPAPQGRMSTAPSRWTEGQYHVCAPEDLQPSAVFMLTRLAAETRKSDSISWWAR